VLEGRRLNQRPAPRLTVSPLSLSVFTPSNCWYAASISSSLAGRRPRS
jgi:hypothetical protein